MTPTRHAGWAIKEQTCFQLGVRKHVRVAQLEESGKLPAEVVLGRWVRVCRARGEARGAGCCRQRALFTTGALCLGWGSGKLQAGWADMGGDGASNLLSSQSETGAPGWEGHRLGSHTGLGSDAGPLGFQDL